mgnify:CR=1 FL=1
MGGSMRYIVFVPCGYSLGSKTSTGVISEIIVSTWWSLGAKPLGVLILTGHMTTDVLRPAFHQAVHAPPSIVFSFYYIAPYFHYSDRIKEFG